MTSYWLFMIAIELPMLIFVLGISLEGIYKELKAARKRQMDQLNGQEFKELLQNTLKEYNELKRKTKKPKTTKNIRNNSRRV